MSSHILLIGAGIGGLTAALALQRFGHSVRVFEQVPALGEIGAGIMLSPNATRVLFHLGLGSQLLEYGTKRRDSSYRRYDTAEITMYASPETGDPAVADTPYIHIHRADLHAILSRAVLANDQQCVHPGARLVSFVQTGDEVTANFANHESVTGSALIGCDGVRSTVRERLFGETEARFTGQVAWRGLVPTDGLPMSITATSSTAWIGAGKHVINYSVRQGKLMNFVAMAQQDAWEDEGWVRRSSVDELVREFSGWNDDLLTLFRNTPRDECFKWGLFDRDPLPYWGNGRVTLLGDAAHPTLPFLAQGSAMAIEDGLVLARAISSTSSIPEGLKRYEEARKERASWIVLESRARTTLLQRTEGEKSTGRVMHLEKLYSYDASTAAI